MVKCVHEGLVFLGIAILVVGLGGYFYYESHYIVGIEISRNYPYRDLGTILVLGGIICIAIGVVYSPRKAMITKEANQNNSNKY
jgi:hypothetical protein